MDKQKKVKNFNLSNDTIYYSLREEILKRIEIRYDLNNYALAVFGVLTTLGLEKKSALILFMYPIIGFGLSLAWMDNHIRLKRLGNFLRAYETPWETDVKEYAHSVSDGPSTEIMGGISTITIFIGTQSLSLLAGCYIIDSSSASELDMIGRVIVLIAIILTAIAFVIARMSAQSK